MYIFDLLKRICSKENVTTMIYLVLNIILTGAMVYLFTGGTYNFFACLGIGFIGYFISITIAVSPIGEWIVRVQSGCKKIKDPQIDAFIRPLFDEVYAQAKAVDPNIHPNVKLFINDDECPNAFAIGRRTVCVTKGMLNEPVECIKATLGHEFGHISHKDTDLLLLVVVGNMIIDGFIFMIRACVLLFEFCCIIASAFSSSDSGEWVARMLTHLASWMVLCIVGGLSRLWTMLGLVLVRKSSRNNEFRADAFSCYLGYKEPLCELLESFGTDDKPQGLFAALASTHPENSKRIAALRELDPATMEPPIDDPAFDGELLTGISEGVTGIMKTAKEKAGQVGSAAKEKAGQMGGAAKEKAEQLKKNREQKQIGSSGQYQIPEGQSSAGGQGTVYGGQSEWKKDTIPAAAAVKITRKFCDGCGNVMSNGTKFCTKCGQKANLFCPSCGYEETEDGVAFCEHCGTKLI